MFWLEGGIELLTPRWEPAILSTRPEGITLNVNDFIKIYTTRPKIKIFFWHHARYYRHLVPKYKLKIYVLNVNNILHDAKKNFNFCLVVFRFLKSFTINVISSGLVVRIAGFHLGVWGSIPPSS